MKQWTVKEKQNWLALLHSSDESNQAIAISLLVYADEVLEEFVLAANLKLLMHGAKHIFEDFFEFRVAHAKKQGWKDINESAVLFLNIHSKHFSISAQYSNYSNLELFKVYQPYHQYLYKLIPLHHFYKELFLKTAVTYIQSGHITPLKIHILFDSVLLNEPKNAMALFHLAIFYQKKCKDFDTAILLWKQFLQIYPQKKVAKYQTFKKIISGWQSWTKQPSTVRALSHLGLVYYEMEDYQNALRYLQKAYDLGIPDKDPTIPFLELIEVVWFYRESPKKAMNITLQGIRFIDTYAPPSPQNPLLICKLWELAGDIAHQEFGDLKDALHFYKKGLEQKPNYLSILTKKLKIIVEEKKDYTQAEVLCKQILKVGKDNSTALRYQGIIKQRRGY